MSESFLTGQELHALRELDRRTVSNPIECFKPSAALVWPARLCAVHSKGRRRPWATQLLRACAATNSRLPNVGMPDGSDWWKSILELRPRIVVLEGVDGAPGRGAFTGDDHSAILQSRGYLGVATNRAVRELSRIREIDS